MAAQTSLETAWLECEALRGELEIARQQITSSTHAVRCSLDVRSRARAYVKQRPVVIAVASAVAGLAATRLIPLLIWRKNGLLGRFTGELAKGLAGMALPFVLNRFNRARPHNIAGDHIP
jgi:hypothetical protein